MFQYDWKDYERETPEWFRDAKFGLFFHWGPYSVAEHGSEWYSRNIYDKGHEQWAYHEATFGKNDKFGYKDLIPLFTAEKFDPAVWAELVELSGAKYAGPVAEHADNFSLWDSRVNPVNAAKMGPHRDVVGECFAEFRKRNIRCLATFHHQWLWGWYMGTDIHGDVYDPANRVYYGPILPLETNQYIPRQKPDGEFNALWRDKVLEVIAGYQPDAVYFDSRANLIPDLYKQQVCDALYRREDTLITYKQFDFPEKCATVDIECGRFAECKPFPWQTDDKLEELNTWCYTKDPQYKSAERIIHQLCDIVSKNGNLLLNVGPRYDGTFHPDAVAALREIGEWLGLNGEAIYGTRPWEICQEGPTLMQDNNFDEKHIDDQVELGYMLEDTIEEFTAQDIRFTRKGDSVYAIALGKPQEGRLLIRSLKAGSGMDRIEEVSMVGTGEPVKWERGEEGLTVWFPESLPCKYAYAFRIK